MAAWREQGGLGQAPLPHGARQTSAIRHSCERLPVCRARSRPVGRLGAPATDRGGVPSSRPAFLPQSDDDEDKENTIRQAPRALFRCALPLRREGALGAFLRHASSRTAVHSCG